MYIKTVEVVALGHRRRTWFVYGLAVHQKDGTDAVTCSEPTSKQSNHYWYKIVGKTKEYAQMVLDLTLLPVLCAKGNKISRWKRVG